MPRQYGAGQTCRGVWGLEIWELDLIKKSFNLEPSGDEVYGTNSSLFLIKITLGSKRSRWKVFEPKVSSYKIEAHRHRVLPPCECDGMLRAEPESEFRVELLGFYFVLGLGFLLRGAVPAIDAARFCDFCFRLWVWGLHRPRVQSQRWQLIPLAFLFLVFVFVFSIFISYSIFFDSCFEFCLLHFAFYVLGMGFEPSKGLDPAVTVDFARVVFFSFSCVAFCIFLFFV